jgi:hypothetical protein
MRTYQNGVLLALPLLVLVIATPTALADGPLQARIHPPGGFTSQSRIKPPSGDPTEGSRILPPSGEPTPASRIRPPSGEPSFFELLLEWMRAQARIHPPIG